MQGYLQLVLLHGRSARSISVTLTIAIAYPLSRRTLFGRNVIMSADPFTMLFSGGLIPTYLVVQDARHARHPVGADDPAARSGSGR